jgi:hypothetical protein
MDLDLSFGVFLVSMGVCIGALLILFFTSDEVRLVTYSGWHCEKYDLNNVIVNSASNTTIVLYPQSNFNLNDYCVIWKKNSQCKSRC